MQVINDRARTRVHVTCPDCMSTLEITAEDVTSVIVPGLTNWGSDTAGWQLTCGACHHTVVIPAPGNLFRCEL